MLGAAGLLLTMSWLKGYSEDRRLELDLVEDASAQATPAGATTTPAATPAATQPGLSRGPAPTAEPYQWQLLDHGVGDPNIVTCGSLDPGSGYLFEVRFHRQGAAVHTLKLSDTFTTVADKKAWQESGGDHAAYMAKVRASGGKLQGHYSLLNPVGPLQAFATKRIAIAIRGASGSPKSIPLDRFRWKHESTTATTGPAERTEVTFSTLITTNTSLTQLDPSRPTIRLTKTYVVAKGDYSIRMRLRAENLSDVPLKIYLDQLGPTGVPREELYRGGDDRFLVYGWQSGQGGGLEVTFREHGELQGDEIKVGEPIALGRSDDAEPVVWLGESNKFFASMMYLNPAVETEGQLAAPSWMADYYFLAEREPARPNTERSKVHIPAVRIGGVRKTEGVFDHAPDMNLAPHAAKDMVLDLFAGPKKRDMLANASAPHSKPLYQKLRYIDSIKFGGCWFCACDQLTLGMMWLLQKISSITMGNYGVAIMILVVLVRLVLHPLTKKSQLNMMKMQKLGPEMERIRKKYADDKEAMNREMMKIYKTQSSAFLGCLPMFLQMPIWISLWGSLNAAVELRHAAFLPVWITDLAAPDAILSWSVPFEIPLLGGMTGPIRSFNLLPILLSIAMFLQAKLNPQMTGAAAPTAQTEEQQAQQRAQQKMMRIMMPAMMLLIFYNAACGLTLYIMTSTFAGVVEQMYIRKHIEAQKAAEAAEVTTVKVPGKAPRGARPKKPKGPNFFKKG